MNFIYLINYVRNYRIAILYTKAILDMQNYHRSGRVHSSVFYFYSFLVQDWPQTVVYSVRYGRAKKDTTWRPINQ